MVDADKDRPFVGDSISTLRALCVCGCIYESAAGFCEGCRCVIRNEMMLGERKGRARPLVMRMIFGERERVIRCAMEFAKF